jgi:hypothetical protein
MATPTAINLPTVASPPVAIPQLNIPHDWSNLTPAEQHKFLDDYRLSVQLWSSTAQNSVLTTLLSANSVPSQQNVVITPFDRPCYDSVNPLDSQDSASVLPWLRSMDDVFNKFGILEESSRKAHLLRFTKSTPGTDIKLGPLCAAGSDYQSVQRIILDSIGPLAPVESVLINLVKSAPSVNSRQDWVLKIRNSNSELAIVSNLTSTPFDILAFGLAALSPYSANQRFKVEQKMGTWAMATPSSFTDRLCIALPNEWPPSIRAEKIFQLDADCCAVQRPFQTSTKRPPRARNTTNVMKTVRPSGCQGCGGSCKNRMSCPAQGKTCNVCKIKHHFASVCRSGNKRTDRVNKISVDDTETIKEKSE